jgi:hypothetical protein
MAYSRIVYPGDGVTVQFAVNFQLGFLSRDDVTARVGSEVDGLGQPAYRTLTWINDGLVQISGAAPAIGVNLVLERTVDKDALIHDYSDGAPIIEANLDDSNKQNLMAVHEVLDGRFGVLQQNLDLGGFRIVNLGAPSDTNDAANKAYVDLQLSIGNGNVPVPGAGAIGKFLKALTATTWDWVSLTLADLGVSFPLLISLGGTGAASKAGAQTNLDILPTTGGTMTGDITMSAGKLVAKQGADIASANTVNLATATGNAVVVTGNTNIKSFGNPQDGARFTVFFTGTPLISNAAAVSQPINLLGAIDETLLAGTVKEFVKRNDAWYEVGGGGSGENDLFNYYNFI